MLSAEGKNKNRLCRVQLDVEQRATTMAAVTHLASCKSVGAGSVQHPPHLRSVSAQGRARAALALQGQGLHSTHPLADLEPVYLMEHCHFVFTTLHC